MTKNSIKYALIVLCLIALVIILGIALSNSQSTEQQSQNSATQLDAMVGKPLPLTVQLYDKDGKAYTAEKFKGKNTILFFSEGIMCYPACWDEIASLATDQRFNNDNSAVFSVVTDQPQEWVTAKQKMPELNSANILFDRGSVASKQLGILNLPSSMHIGTMPGHTYIVLDKQGIVGYVYDDPNMAKNADRLAQEIVKFNN